MKKTIIFMLLIFLITGCSVSGVSDISIIDITLKKTSYKEVLTEEEIIEKYQQDYNGYSKTRQQNILKEYSEICITNHKLYCENKSQESLYVVFFTINDNKIEQCYNIRIGDFYTSYLNTDYCVNIPTNFLIIEDKDMYIGLSKTNIVSGNEVNKIDFVENIRIIPYFNYLTYESKEVDSDKANYVKFNQEAFDFMINQGLNLEIYIKDDYNKFESVGGQVLIFMAKMNYANNSIVKEQDNEKTFQVSE